jgi:hypothetical protein
MKFKFFNRKKIVSKILRILIFSFFVINPNLLMMFTKFISGENSISQVFYGTFLGFWTVFISLWILKPAFIDHYIVLFNPEIKRIQ